MTSAGGYYRKFFCGFDILNDSDIQPASKKLTTCSPEDAHSLVGALKNDGVRGVTFSPLHSSHEIRGALLVRGLNKDGGSASVRLLLRTLERSRALSNNLEPGVVYAELKTAYDQRAIKMSATTELILPMLQEPDEPAT